MEKETESDTAPPAWPALLDYENPSAGRGISSMARVWSCLVGVFTLLPAIIFLAGMVTLLSEGIRSFSRAGFTPLELAMESFTLLLCLLFVYVFGMMTFFCFRAGITGIDRSEKTKRLR